MPLPIGPIVGAAVRAAATKFAGRAATSAAGRAVSVSQFGRGASMLGKSGKLATLGRGAVLMSAFGGSSSGLSSGGTTMPMTPATGPVKKQGLDTYGDEVY